MKFRFILFLLLWVFSGFAQAKSLPITVERFKAMATELAPRVDLFRDIWAQDPNAELVSGTMRDYLYWLKNQLIAGQNAEDVEKIYQTLLKQPLFEVRDFIGFDSDIDVVSNRLNLDPGNYVVKKIDYISGTRFDTNTHQGVSEIDQGFIPIEKIRMNRRGFIDNGAFGDGVSEIFHGQPTIAFPEAAKFWKTDFAAKGLNHPILLVLRYIRAVSLSYSKDNPGVTPTPQTVLSLISENDRNEIRKVVSQINDDKNFSNFLKSSKSQEWFDSAISKAFRAYLNPTATMHLFREFKLDEFVAKYSDFQVNQFVFSKYHSPEVVAENLKKFQIKPENFYKNPKNFFGSKLLAFHGTKTEQSFNDILYRGIVPSNGGTSGAGLYVVNESSRGFAENWGGSKNRLIEFEVSPNAKLVDLTQSENKQIFDRAVKELGLNIETFCDYFGIDILKYEYQADAYVIKNSQVISKPRSVYRSFTTFKETLALAAKIGSVEEAYSLVVNLQANQRFNTKEKLFILQQIESKYYHPDLFAYATQSNPAEALFLLKLDLAAQLTFNLQPEQLQKRETLNSFVEFISSLSEEYERYRTDKNSVVNKMLAERVAKLDQKTIDAVTGDIENRISKMNKDLKKSSISIFYDQLYRKKNSKQTRFGISSRSMIQRPLFVLLGMGLFDVLMYNAGHGRPASLIGIVASAVITFPLLKTIVGSYIPAIRQLYLENKSTYQQMAQNKKRANDAVLLFMNDLFRKQPEACSEHLK